MLVRPDRFGEPTRRDPGRGDRRPRARAARRPGRDDGRGRELQQRLGGARSPGRRDEVAGAMGRADRLPHRRLRRERRRLRGRQRRHERRRSATTSWSTRGSGTSTTRGSRRARTPAWRRTFRVWGYDTCWGSIAQFTKVQAHQCLPKADHLTWEEAAAPTLTGGTAYRMLFGWPPHTVQPGDVVLVWGGSGGLGSLAIQLVANAGGRAVAVVSSDEKGEYCKTTRRGRLHQPQGLRSLGRAAARGTRPSGRAGSTARRRSARRSGRRSARRRARASCSSIPGQDTIPTSNFVCDRGGMIVICAGTTGYDTMIDVRYLWFMQKRYQGSHLMNDEQAIAFNDLVREGKIETTLGHTYAYDEIPLAHQLMADGKLPEGNVSCLVNAPAGLTDSVAPARTGVRVPLQRSWTSSTSTPPIARGWTNAINVLRDPGRGARRSTGRPRRAEWLSELRCRPHPKVSDVKVQSGPSGDEEPTRGSARPRALPTAGSDRRRHDRTNKDLCSRAPCSLNALPCGSVRPRAEAASTGRRGRPVDRRKGRARVRATR